MLDVYFGKKFRAEQQANWTTSPKEYWTLHTVHQTKDELTTRKDSRAYFDWRCSRYPGYLELMPVSGHSGQRVLDYGCGPGHDLVGFLEFSSPALLVGADVSTTAIDLAKKRVRLHPGGQSTMFVQTSDLGEIQFSENKKIEFDYIHCSGVLHHVSEPVEVLLSFKRVLAPGGRIRLMVYNRDSIWRNFYVPYVLQHRRKAIDSDLNLNEAFRMSTDGPGCPISRSYDTDSMTALAAIAGLNCKKIGTAFSQFELNI